MLQDNKAKQVSFFQVKIVKSSQGGLQRVWKNQCCATVKVRGKKKFLAAKVENRLKKLEKAPSK